MNWDECMTRSGLVERRMPDKELAKSLLNMAEARFEFFYSDSKNASVFAMEGVYEAILELCHAFLALDGLKTVSHECAIEFLRGRHLDDYETELLQKMRKNRHKIKYYGISMSPEILKMHMENGRTLFLKLKSVLENKLS